MTKEQVLNATKDWYHTRPPKSQVWILLGAGFFGLAIFMGLVQGAPQVSLGYMFITFIVFAPQIWYHYSRQQQELQAQKQSGLDDESFEKNLKLKGMEYWHDRMDQGVDPDQEIQQHYIKTLQRHLNVPVTGELDIVTVRAARACRCEFYCKSTMDILGNQKWRDWE